MIYFIAFGNRKEKRKALLTSLPVLVLAMTAGIILAFNLNPSSNAGFYLKGITPYQYLITEFRVYLTYLRLIFLPIGLNIDYDYPLFNSFFNPQVIFSFLFIISLILLGVYIVLFKDKFDRRLCVSGFGILWFFIILMPTSTIVPLRDLIVEHRLYLPLEGITLAFCGFILYLFRKINESDKSVVIISAVILMMVLSFLTFERNTVWANPIKLWSDVTLKSPRKARAYQNLGYFYQEIGDLKNAEKNYLLALKFAKNIITMDYDILNNLASLYGELGQYKKALKYSIMAYKKNHHDPYVLNNLALSYLYLGDTQKAIYYSKRAIKSSRYFYFAYNTLGQAYLKEGRCKDALQNFMKVYRLHKEDDRVYYNISISYLCLGNYTLADKFFNEYYSKEKDKGLRTRLYYEYVNKKRLKGG